MSHLFIFDKDETLLDILDAECYYDDNYKRQLNGEWSFTFYVKFEHLKHLEKPNKIGFFDKEEQFQLFKIQDCEDVFGNEESFEIYCVHDSYSLGELIIEDKRVIGGTARDAIAKCLENSNYSIGNVADLGGETLSFYFISKLQGLHDIVETYGGELDFRFELDESKTRIVNRYVDLKYRLGEDTGLRFTFDLNLQGVTRNRISEGHFTVLYGRGKSLEVGDGYSRRLTFDEVAWNKPTNPLNKPLGDKFLVDPDAVARFGRIEGIYENDSIEDAEELLKATHKALEDAKEPKISYSATVEDLSNLSGYEHLKFVLGDSIIIQDEKYQLNNKARIVSEEYSIKNKKEPKQVTLGYIQKGISDSLGGGSITNPTITAPNEVKIDDSDFPNTLPKTPILKAKGLFSSVMLEWTFESKTYYNYEIYASKIQHFNPDSSNLIFKGKASSLLHEVKPSETWYYRARAINTHGEVTEMSEEVSATTFKISDAAEYFEEAAIQDALIGQLSLDRGWFGKLKGHFMDVKNLVVTDGNDVRTMYVDDFGRVHMDVSELKINSKDIISKEQTETLIEAKAGEISLEVAKKEVATAKSEIDKTLEDYSTTTEMTSAIKLAKESIELNVKTNYETKSEVDKKINGIQIGGRNLIKNSALNGNSNWQNANVDTSKKYENCNSLKFTGSSSSYSSTTPAKLGDVFTISAKSFIETSGGNLPLIIFEEYKSDGTTNRIYFQETSVPSTANSWQTYTKTWTVGHSETTHVRVRFYNRRASFNWWVSQPMLEKGNKATDYTVAPEDVETSITTAKNEVKEYTNSQISIAKNEINLGVKNTYETKTNVESKVNTGLNNAKSYADTKKQEAINSASTDATNKVNNAKNELNTAISKKANSSDVYTKTEVYTKAQTDSQIQIAKDAINLGVSQNYETKTEVTNKVNTAVNGIQIGGRNLAQKTSSSYSAPYTSFNGSNNICPSLAKVLTDGLSVGDTVTVRLVYKYNNVVSVSGQTAQCWIQGSGNVTAWNQGGFESPPKKTINGSGEIEFLYNFKITSKHLQNAYWDTSIRHDYVQSGSIQFKMFKVEKGTKPSDWSPAPEDVNTAIENTKSETKSYTDSKIQLAKNEIDLSVKTNYETKTEVSNKVNKAIDSVRVGGRNLIIRHNELKNMMVGADGTFSTYNGSSLMSTYIEVTEGESLMFTQTFQGDGDNYFRYAFYAEDRRTVVQRTPNNSKTFNVFVPKTAKWLRVSYDTSNLVKIERGNKASDWSPAPEDVDASITTAKNEVKEYTNSQIKLAKNEIDLSVKGTYETKTEVTNKVNNAINGLQIGARNLVVQSPTLNNQFNPLGTYKGKRTIVDDTTAKSKKHIKFECTTAGRGFYTSLWLGDNSCVGKQFTWSFYAKMNKAKRLNDIGHERSGMSSIDVTTEWKKFTHTWTYASSGNRAFVFYPNFEVGDILYIKDLQIEEGNKASDWSPAPEDTELLVSNTKNEVKEYTKSQINIAKGEITQTVASTYETKSEVTNKINGVNSTISNLTSRVNQAEQKITDSAIIQTVSQTINNAKTEAINSANSNTANQLKNYSTTHQMNSAINQKADEITSTVEVTKNAGVEILPQSHRANSISGYYFSLGTMGVNGGGLHTITKDKTWVYTDLIPIDRTKPIHCAYQWYTEGTGMTHIGFEQYDIEKREIGANASTIYWRSAEVTNAVVQGEFTHNANSFDAACRYIRLRILTNWNANPSHVYTQFWTISAKQLTPINATTQIAQMSDEIESKVDVNGVKSIVRQSPEDLRIGFNGMTDNLVVHDRGLRTNAPDGSYSEFQDGQVTHYIAGANYKYHSLTHVETIVSQSQWCVIDGTYYVPERFRNKNFNVIATVSYVAFDRNVDDAYKNLNISVTEINPANCSYRLHCTPIGVNIGGRYTVNASKLEVVVTVIA